MDILKDYIDANPSEFHQFTDDELVKLHEILLDMINDLILFCKEKNLTLFAGGGTMLGAVRHKGFIPWDDDVDLTMMRADCDVLLSEYVDYYKGKYFIEAPNSRFVGNHVFIKIKKTNTVMTDLLTKKGCSGFCIDIFPMDYASNSRLVRKLKGVRFMTVRNILYVISFARQYDYIMKEGFKNCSLKTRIVAKLGVGVGKLFGIIPLEKWINHFDRIVRRKKETNYIAIASGIHSYEVETFPKDVYFPVRSGSFEGGEITLPGKVEVILERFYGDYMTPPPPEKRAKHFFLALDVNGKDS